jgi:hypothetical protein
LIFKWILLLEIHTNYKNWVGRKNQLNPKCVHIWVNDTRYISNDEKENMHMSKHKKLMTKKCFIMITIFMIKHKFNIFDYMINFHSYFVFGTHFYWIITKLIICFHICSILHFIITINPLHNHALGDHFFYDSNEL